MYRRHGEQRSSIMVNQWVARTSESISRRLDRVYCQRNLKQNGLLIHSGYRMQDYKMVTDDCFFIDKLNNHFICQNCYFGKEKTKKREREKKHFKAHGETWRIYL